MHTEEQIRDRIAQLQTILDEQLQEALLYTNTKNFPAQERALYASNNTILRIHELRWVLDED